MKTSGKISLILSYCLFNDIKHVDLNLLSIIKKCIKNTDVVANEIKYITTLNINNQNIYNKLPLCLSFSDVDAYIIEENKNKYLIFASRENNRKMFKMYKKLRSKIKKQIECNSVEYNSIETISSSKCNSTKSIKYEKDPMKIKFDSYDDDLPLNKILWFSDLNKIVESVFQIKGKYYPQIHIHECECEKWY